MSMLRNAMLIAAACATAAVLLSAPLKHALAADAPPAAGHCSFTLKNQWSGPYKACVAPADADQCTELGKADENSDATWSAGACPTASVVGSCKRSKDTLYYYEGDASGLELGCGFQSGEWKTGG